MPLPLAASAVRVLGGPNSLTKHFFNLSGGSFRNYAKNKGNKKVGRNFLGEATLPLLLGKDMKIGRILCFATETRRY